MGRKSSLSFFSLCFLSRHHTSIISSSPWQGREVFLSCLVRLGLSQHFGKIIPGLSTMKVFILRGHLSLNDCLCVCVHRPYPGSHKHDDFAGQIIGLICYHHFIVWGALCKEHVLKAREHVLGVINSLSSLGRIQFSVTIVLLFVGMSCFCCIVLLRSKLA